MKTYVYFEEEIESRWITRGKRYEVIDTDGKAATILDDDGDEIFILLEGHTYPCTHLEEMGNWKVETEDE